MTDKNLRKLKRSIYNVLTKSYKMDKTEAQKQITKMTEKLTQK